MIYDDVMTIIKAGGYNLADLLHRIDVLYASGRLTDEQRATAVQSAQDGANPDDSLPDDSARIGALELRVADLEAKVAALVVGTQPGDDGEDGETEQPATVEEWPAYVRPTSKDMYYHKGDKITYTDGKRYVCVKNNVVDGPDVDPKCWELYDEPQETSDADGSGEES